MGIRKVILSEDRSPLKTVEGRHDPQRRVNIFVSAHTD